MVAQRSRRVMNQGMSLITMGEFGKILMSSDVIRMTSLQSNCEKITAKPAQIPTVARTAVVPGLAFSIAWLHLGSWAVPGA